MTDLRRTARLLATPGHPPQDITTLVGTAEDVVARTHLWRTFRPDASTPRSAPSLPSR